MSVARHTVVITAPPSLCKRIGGRLKKYFGVRFNVSGKQECEIMLKREGYPDTRMCSFMANEEVKNIMTLFWLKNEQLKVKPEPLR